MELPTKKIKLNDLHEKLGAKMVGFAGYLMPVRYTSEKDEHFAVRQGIGVFDVSHMGEFFISGPEAKPLLQRVVSNDVEKLFVGKAQYAYLPNSTGGIVDDLLVYQIGEQEYMLVVNASNIEKDWQWIQQHNTGGATMLNASDQLSLFAVQGPKSIEAMQSLTSVNLAEMKFYTFQKATFAGVEDVIVSATGYTGSGGFELYVPNENAEKVWHAIFEAGAAYGIKPAGLAARDTLRLEKGYCLYGNDIDDTTSPIAAGLGWVTKFTKEFINAEAIKAQKQTGPKQKLVGLKVVDKGIPRKGYVVESLSPGDSGKEIGVVTSGTISPILGTGIALAYVDSSHAAVDNEVAVVVRGRQIIAKVTKLPFVD